MFSTGQILERNLHVWGCMVYETNRHTLIYVRTSRPGVGARLTVAWLPGMLECNHIRAAGLHATGSLSQLIDVHTSPTTSIASELPGDTGRLLACHAC